MLLIIDIYFSECIHFTVDIHASKQQNMCGILKIEALL